MLRAGDFEPGAPLVAAELAKVLGVSITPIREALAHLAGEGLIDERRGRGYFAHRLDVAELDSLYRLHWIYVAAALDEAVGRSPSLSDAQEGEAFELSPGHVRDRVEALFAAIVRAAGNPILAIAHRAIVDRLAAPRLQEDRVLENIAEEIRALVLAIGHADPATIRAVLFDYHERRLAASKRMSLLLQGG
jgi:DNA-binding GntR family transcriptional regulator